MKKEDLSERRTLIAQEEYYKKVINKINSNKKEKIKARYKVGLYKKLFEEFYQLLQFTKLKYGKEKDIEFRWVGDEQQNKTINYDGEIFKDGNLIDKVEITCPLFSKRDNDIAKELNNFGVSSLEIGNLKDILEENQVKVVENINNNKNINLHYDNTITLLIYIEDERCFDDIINITKLKNDLKNIILRFKEVYILINKGNDLSLEKIN